jgi:nucleoid DNA-binding protein
VKRKNPHKPTNKTRTEIRIAEEIAESAQISTDQVAAVLDQLTESIMERVKNGQIFTFSAPGLMTVKAVMRKAIKSGQGINPFTKEIFKIRPQPARIVAKITPNGLKRKPKQTLTEMVSKKPKSKSFKPA